MTYILLDTNIYLHCQSFDSLPLKKIVGATDEVSILLPMQVLRELDKKKDDKSDSTVNKRARTVSSKFGNYLLKGKKPPVPILTCEMPPKEEFKQGFLMEVADDVILMSAVHFLLSNPGKLVVVSRDMAMLLKAKQLNLPYVEMPDEYVLPGNQVDKEKQQLKDELDRLQRRLPAPIVAFSDGEKVLHIKRLFPKEPVLEDNLTEKERDFCLLREKSLASKERFYGLTICVFNNGSAPTDDFTVQLDVSKLKICKTSNEIESMIVPERFRTEKDKNIMSYDLEEWEDLEDLKEREPIHKFVITYKDETKKVHTNYKDEFESITHGLHHDIYYFTIDLYEATSGSIDWILNVPALPDSVKGTLHVVVDE